MEGVTVYLQECHNLLFCCDRAFVTYNYNDGDDRERVKRVLTRHFNYVEQIVFQIFRCMHLFACCLCFVSSPRGTFPCLLSFTLHDIIIAHL